MKGDLFIFPGLLIEGFSRPTKKFADYKITFGRAQIEEFADQIANFSDEAMGRAQTDLNMLIHDLRSISTTIYNAAEEAHSLINLNKNHEAAQRIKNVIAAQTILKIRTDVLDLAGNPSADLTEVDVPIFQRVDKVCRCFKPRASELGQIITLTGKSRRMAKGPNVFEIIPYVLIDNALKYASRGHEVVVDVNDVSYGVELTVSSPGPEIGREELVHIFDKGVRGKHAVDTGKEGSGIGLYLASRIVSENFGGTISANQDSGQQGAHRLLNTTFVVRIPIGAPSK